MNLMNSEIFTLLLVILYSVNFVNTPPHPTKPPNELKNLQLLPDFFSIIVRKRVPDGYFHLIVFISLKNDVNDLLGKSMLCL